MSDAANRALEYRKRAQECVRLAERARTSEQRAALLDTAQTWLRLADEAVQWNTVISVSGDKDTVE